VKIAIHDNSGSFSDRWITYCEKNKIDFKKVNCYDTDIIQQLDDCDGLMWNWSQNDYKAALCARQLTKSLEKKGIKVFPDTNTSWHFDDKVGQKYLLESIGAPLVKSYVFYSAQEAFEWAEKTSFPKVFKLRGGAASINVSLVKTKKKARHLIKKAFTNGFLPINRISNLKDRFGVLQRNKDLAAVKKMIGGFGRLFIPTEIERFSHNQKGYIYFQDFIPNNHYDTRLVVIGNRCFGCRRYCRKNDFRASGSGLCEYEPELFDKKSIQYAFETARKLETQSVAFDFVMLNNEPKIVEISYCFPMEGASDDCLGYFDSNLNWYYNSINMQSFMVEDFINKLKIGNKTL
jgi:glutathione synthase/RimK-type ligase-like ATP-grasp enzyme